MAEALDWAALQQALDARDHRGALALLLAQWRRAPAPYLAELVERIGELGLTDANRSVPGTRTAKIEAWDRIEEAGDPLDLPRLVDSLLGLGPLYVPLRLERLIARGPDPRLARRLVAWAEERPNKYQGRASEPLWRMVADGLAKMQDVRGVDALRTLLDTLEQRRIYAADRVLLETLPAVHGALAAAAASPVEPPPAAKRLLGLLPGGAPAPSAAAEELLDRVYADPASDELRWVLADVWTEAGEPRGEFVSLQMRERQPGAKLTRAQRQRMRELEREHGRDWLGPLKFVAKKTGLRFERGFLAACRISQHPSVETLVGVRELATVEELDLQAYGTVDFFDEAHLTSLRVLQGDCAAVFRARRALPVRRIASVERLPLDGVSNMLAGCRSLPELASLRIGTRSEPIEAWRTALASPFAAPLRELELVWVRGEPAAWRRMIREAAPQLERFSFGVNQGSVTVEPRDGHADVCLSWDVSAWAEHGAYVSGSGAQPRSLTQLGVLLAADLIEPTDALTLRLVRGRNTFHAAPVDPEQLATLRRSVEGRVARLEIEDVLPG